jgi:hypothetical protein
MKTNCFKFIALTLILFLGRFLEIGAQTFVGAQIDNRAGIRGLTLNPANVVNPRLKSELNLFSSSAFFGNDYIGVGLSDLSGFTDEFDFDETFDVNAKPDNNFVGNLDILGPSFQINLSEKHSVALSTRVRGFFNLNNIGGEFFETVITGESGDETGYVVEMENLSGITNVWAEIGATYGRQFISNDKINLKGAATLKYLGGAGGLIGSSEVLGGLYVDATNTLTTRGRLNYGYSSGFESGEIDFGGFTSGFGMDLGFIFELKSDSENSYQDGYKLRAGLSVMDIGSINYSGFTQFQYNMDKTISADQFEDGNLSDILEENYEGTSERGSARLGMPTSLQIFTDYSITNKFYVSVLGSLSLKDHGDLPVSQVINSVSLTPRFESGWISVYSPLSYRQYEGNVSWGLGLRLGPVIVGSGSILTNLLSKNSRSTDAYFGLQIPFYKKGTKIKSTTP